MPDDVVPSKTRKVVLGCGNVYITVDERSYTDSRPHRVFMRRGRAGDCARVLMESVARGVTIMLQSDVPLKRICRTFQGMRCEKGYIGHISCIDELGKMLAEYLPAEEEGDGTVHGTDI